MATFAYSQKSPVIYNITTKDNRSYQTKGYFIKTKYLKFKTLKGEKVQLPYNLIFEIKYEYKKNKRKNAKLIKVTERFIPISNRNGFLMELLVDGYCQLYVNGAGGHNHFWVIKKDEKIATILYMEQLIRKSFKRAALEYFKDCPSLIEKIKSKEFTRKNVKEIVEYYNAECKK